MNHPMIDGNKRIGAQAMLLFLEINDVHLKYTQKELIDIILNVAKGESSYDDLRKWIITHKKT